MIQGIDISQFQGNVDFATLKAHESFVMIRANFGTPNNSTVLNEDADFQKNRDAARSIGIPHGFYHYAYPEYNTPEAEADFFASILGDLQQGELLALDFEESYAGDHVAWVKGFLDRLSSHFNGYKPLLYINYNEATTHDWTPVINGDYGCWLADWDGTTSENYPKVQWAELAIKQYNDNSSVPGITGNVDGDVFYGDVGTFEKYGYNPPAPTAPTDPLAGQVATLQSQVTSLTAQLATANAAKSTLQTEYDALTNTDAQKDATIATLNTEVTNITNQLNTEKTAHASDVTALNKQVTLDTDEITQLNSKIATLEAELKTSTTPQPQKTIWQQLGDIISSILPKKK